MQLHSDMIRSFGDEGTACARALTNVAGHKIDREAVYKWKETDSIPYRYWHLMVQAAVNECIPGITIESLAKAASKKAA